ncbi:MAG: hypothetical protein RIC16_04250 [Rhodospirillales bacterium]
MDDRDSNTSTSIEDLDALIESDRHAAAIIAKAVFDQQVLTAIHSVTEANRLATARIMADTRVTCTKITTDAIVCCAELAGTVDALVSEIRHHGIDLASTSEEGLALVAEIAKNTRQEITESSENAVEVIERQAHNAIHLIAKNAENAVEDIKAIADEAARRVISNAREAARKIAESKETHRTGDSARTDGQAAAAKVSADADSATLRLTTRTKDAIEDIEQCLESTLQELADVADDAQRRIYAARDQAIDRIGSLLKSGPDPPSDAD